MSKTNAAISFQLIARVFVASIGIGLFALPTMAQRSSTDGSTPPALTAGAPAGSYALSDFDNINLFNGSLNFRLPLMTVGGRGEAQYTMMLPIETHWRVIDKSTDFQEFLLPTDFTWYDEKPGYSPGRLLGRAVGTDPSGSGAPCGRFATSYISLTRLTFILPDGTEYEFRDQATGGQQKVSSCSGGGFNRGTVFVTADGSAATFVSDKAIKDLPGISTTYPSGFLSLRNGHKYRIDSGRVSWIRDRNGNKLTFAYNDTFLRVTSITDSLNRQISISYADFQGVFCDQITFKGFGGAQRTIRINYSPLQDVLRTNRPGDLSAVQTYKALFPELTGSNGPYNPYKVSSVVLPGGTQQFQFAYNVYGELARVVLPTGGMFEYDFSGAPGADDASGEIYPNEIKRRVLVKRLYKDANTPENQTTFSGLGSIVQVDQLDPSGTILLSRTKHYFYDTGSVGVPPFDYPRWDTTKEYQTEIIDTANCSLATCVTVVRRTSHVLSQGCTVSPWSSAVENNPRVIETDTTLTDTNQVAKQTFSYDCFNNRIDTYEYDFVSGGAAAALLRRTHTDFISATSYTSPGTSAAAGPHLRSLPSQSSVFDASGFERARSSFEYDNYGIGDNYHNRIQPYPRPSVSEPPISGLDASFNSQTNNLVRGNVTAVTRSLFNVSGTSIGSIISYAQYDVAGNVVKAIDPRSTATNIIATTFDFSDRFGSPDTEATSNSSPPELSAVSQASYAFPTLVTNAANHTFYSQFDYSLGRPVNTQDANGIVSAISFSDSLDRATQVIRANNDNSTPSTRSQMSFAYDDVNHVITTRSDLNSFNDANPLKSEAIYDGLGRAIETRQYEDGAKYIAVQTQYDALGRAFRTSNPYRPLAVPAETPDWTKTDFDSLGRVTSVTTPDNAVVTTAYSGNRVLMSDQAGKKRLSVSDALARLKEVWEVRAADSGTEAVSFPNYPDVTAGYRTRYDYDTVGNLIAVNQGNQTRTLVYDSLKHLIAATNPENGTINYDYDENGNLKTKMDSRLLPGTSTRVTTSYVYDALNRPTSRSYNDGTPSVTYSYDATNVPNSRGRLTSVSSSVSSYTYGEYDALGRVKTGTQTTAGQAYTMSYEYNAAGAMTSENYPSGRVVKTNYDDAGRIAGVQNNATGLYYAGAISTDASNRLRYSAAGAIEAMKLGNGLWEHASFNTRLQPTQIGLGSASTDSSILQLDYSYGTSNNNGNLLSQTITVPTVGAVTGFTATQNYTYDSLNRLATAQENNGSSWKQNFDYDRFGNRKFISGTTLPALTPASNPVVNPINNRIDGAATGQGNILYDDAGNLTRDVGGHTYQYDAEGKMVSYDGGVTSAGGASYSYDAAGQRVKKVVGGAVPTTTVFVYDINGQLMAEYADSSPSGSGTSFVTSDTLGSPRVITGSNQQIIGRHDYLPFGEELLAGAGSRTPQQNFGADNLRQKFTSKERDLETGLDYFGARYFSSAQGRFSSADTVLGSPGNPQTLNRYAYVLGNPLRLVDPTGHFAEDDLSADEHESFGDEHESVDVHEEEESPDSELGTTLHYWPARIFRDSNGNQIDKSPKGHIALQLSDGTYISYWPGEHLSDLDFGKEVEPSLNRTYRDDYNGELQTDSQTFTIYGLDEAKIKEWWNNGQGHGKFSTGNNCADIVTQALKQGGLVPMTSNWIWSTPSDVWRGAHRAVEERRNPSAIPDRVIKMQRVMGQ